MRRLVVLAATLLVLGGCGNDGEKSETSEPGTRVPGKGVYEGGVDIPVGVYVSDGKECTASTASTREFDLGGDADDSDALVATSVRVGDVSRIAVRRGEFFRPGPLCGDWVLEEGDGPKLPDPATRAGACTILRGEDDLVQQAVDSLERAAPGTEESTPEGYEIQDKLMAVVWSPVDGVAKGRRIARLAGELVDDLDNPSAFVEDGEVDASVRATIAKSDGSARSWCAGAPGQRQTAASSRTG